MAAPAGGSRWAPSARGSIMQAASLPLRHPRAKAGTLDPCRCFCDHARRYRHRAPHAGNAARFTAGTAWILGSSPRMTKRRGWRERRSGAVGANALASSRVGVGGSCWRLPVGAERSRFHHASSVPSPSSSQGEGGDLGAVPFPPAPNASGTALLRSMIKACRLEIVGRCGPHILNTPNRVSSMGALSAAERDRPSTSRVFAGSMMPSSHRRALE
ncbi:hypothetical protein NTH_03459 [Nitratireductor thuwali]|uniref:Uncharacterized protein n=1 Tax=Nitratireductor thuwali TaxID=2267699 RepID=A0ABY5MQU5_9HYPH|nr:hypothetical protein NTH_03459 [Nitratireductor thuwali]